MWLLFFRPLLSCMALSEESPSVVLCDNRTPSERGASSRHYESACRSCVALRPTAHVRAGLQKSVNFMEQELSRYAFIELFTEDDMNITTMQKLMKDVFREGQEEYCKLQVDLATNAREAVRPAHPA